MASDYFLFINGYQYKSTLTAVHTAAANVPREEAKGDLVLEQLIQEIAQSQYQITYEEVLSFINKNTEIRIL